jgi:hypothetical protein
MKNKFYIESEFTDSELLLKEVLEYYAKQDLFANKIRYNDLIIYTKAKLNVDFEKLNLHEKMWIYLNTKLHTKSTLIEEIEYLERAKKLPKEDFEKRFLTMIKDYKIDEKISDKVIEKVIEDNAKFYGATKEQVKKRAKELGLIKVIYF